MLILVIFYQYISVDIFDNVPFHFALLFTQMKTLHCFHIRLLLEKGDVICDQTKYLKSLSTSIAIFQFRKILTWPWSLDDGKMFISCYIYCSLVYHGLFAPYSSFYFSVFL